MLRTNARTDAAVTTLEKDNAALARRVAQESIVVLENNGALPLRPGRIALYGEGATNTVKGGTGSGEVNARHATSILEGLLAAGFDIRTTGWLNDYNRHVAAAKQQYLKAMRRRSRLVNMFALPYLQAHPFMLPPADALKQADLVADAETCLYIIARQAGEYADRTPTPGDLLMTETEVSNITACAAHYKNTVVVINAGGMVDLGPVAQLNLAGIIFFCQQGGEGGNALADIITGKVCPSGKLTFTWPRSYEDIPFSDAFGPLSKDRQRAAYSEGIYVGCRYFDTFGVKPTYTFGFGLSYTTFALTASIRLEGARATVSVDVKNTGNVAGKQVVQVYVSCPPEGLPKETRRLAGFAKTETLKPGETQRLLVPFSMEELTSFDEAASSHVLDAGDYVVFAGTSAASMTAIAALRLPEKVTVARHLPVCVPEEPIAELVSSRENPPLGSLPIYKVDVDAFSAAQQDSAPAPALLDEEAARLLSRLTTRQQLDLLVGSGLDLALPKRKFFMVPGAAGYTTSKYEKKGIPAVSFCDGPAGLRLFDVSAARGSTVRMVNPVFAFMEVLPLLARKVLFANPNRGGLLYQYATAFPVGMAMAQTWNAPLLEMAGRGVQAEMEAFGAVYWLAPGMNIMRNPLCGRNYEYSSEDPLLSGKLAAALTRGVQHKPGYHVTLKHFCCNNQESNRMQVSSNMSQRALREIYLRGFEIAVREGGADAVMTSYNRVNGTYAAGSHDLCTKVLRHEWGFRGLIMTDWVTERGMLDAAKCVRAGVNIMMPGILTDRRTLRRALRKGTLTPQEVARAAGYVLQGIVSSDVYTRFLMDQPSHSRGEKS